MKKIILGILGIAAFVQGKAQSFDLDFEGNNRNTLAAACWSFPGTTFSGANTDLINGAFTGRTGQLTSLTNWNGVVTPWIKMSSGNISFKHKLTSNGGSTFGTSKHLVVVRIKSDSSVIDTIYNHTYVNGQAGTTINVSINNADTGVWKYAFRFTGLGGTGRGLIDDISFPAVYHSDPTNNCLPLNNNPDADADGVADADDAYPNDFNRAYNNFFPGSGYSTLMFEDLWPAKGDYDFNDLVVDYKINRVTNASNNVVEIKAEFKLRAIGGSLSNGFGFKFDGIAPNKITSVSGNIIKPGSNLVFANNGTENNQTDAVFIVFDDAFHVMPSPGGSGVNVVQGNPTVDPVTINMTITLIDNGTAPSGGTVALSSMGTDKFNPFLIVAQNRGREVHLPGFAPTDLVNSNLFGTDDDKTNPSAGNYYKTANNLPWAINCVQSIPYMQEKNDLTTGYLKFIDWVSSNGTSYTDWYLNNSGYRDANKIY